MLFKIAIKNIKKSIKDYSIYLFTLVFAVAMFYIFNSIDAQASMMHLTESQSNNIQNIVQLISYVSIFVSVILGFLIVYSNNFLIKRRKKEIGIYEVLGMSKMNVSLILIFETLLIGIISLIIGLLVGIFLSQFISIFVSKLFEADLSKLQFIFSENAFYKTILYFGIIFIVVIIFNILVLNRYKLIDLINADRKTEKIKIRNKYTIITSFALSLVTLGYAYYLLLHDNVLLYMDRKTVLMLISGAIGTFLLFFSLSGFIVKIFRNIKKVYYKDLNIFIFKQIESKINTTVLSTTIICLMLLLTIGMLSGSMSMADVFNNNLKDNNLTDYTIRIWNEKGIVTDDNDNVIAEYEAIPYMEDYVKGEEFSKVSTNYVIFHEYIDNSINMRTFMSDDIIKKYEEEYGDSISFGFSVQIVKESEYKAFMELTGQDYINIDENQYLLISNLDLATDAYKGSYEDKTSINVNGNTLIPGTEHIIDSAYENNVTDGNSGLIVVSDDIVNGLELKQISIVGNYVDGDIEKLDKAFNDCISKIRYDEVGFSASYYTKLEMESSSVGSKAMVIFLGLYLGVTFAISSATVLAIGQLSESSDNKKRYKVLNQIGADRKMIDKSLFIQISIIFIFPLIIALVHAFIALRKVNNILVLLGQIDLTSNILLTTLFMVIIYGGYLLLTYYCSKNIVKSE